MVLFATVFAKMPSMTFVTSNPGQIRFVFCAVLMWLHQQ